VSRRAQVDLDDIRDYSVAEFGVARAADYLDSIEAAFRRMLEFPEIGAVQQGVRPPTRSIGCHQHRIFYEVRRDTILIVRILHKAMEVKRHL
jgi:toxin ParE1/3/4